MCLEKQIKLCFKEFSSTLKYIPDRIYHYTKMDTAFKILSDDSVCFHMTNIQDFDDIFEGKTIEVYYDLALYNLKTSGFLNDDIYEMLKDVKVPEKKEMYINIPNNANTTYVKKYPYNVYITCFSTSKNDEYMIKNYTKSDDKKGYCMEFLSREISKSDLAINSFDNGYRISLNKVLYGNQIITYIEEYIKWLHLSAQKIDDEEAIRQSMIFHLEEELHKLKYISKLSKYQKEEEVRLILYLPSDETPDYYTPCFFEQTDEKKRFIKVSFPKSVFFNLFPTKYVKKEEHEQTMEYLSKKNYRLW